jgi:hypothetical protein
MFFNIIHPASLGVLMAFYGVIVARANLEFGQYKRISLKEILLGAAGSLFWIIYGIVQEVNEYILILEGIAVCLTLIALVVKLNMPGKHTLFGKVIPGHGAAEKGAVLVVKRILFTILAAITAIVLLPALAAAIGM